MVDSGEVQGFLCPECMFNFAGSEELMAHFNAEHVANHEQEAAGQLLTDVAPPKVTTLINDYKRLVLDYSSRNKNVDEDFKNLSARAALLQSTLEGVLSGSIITADLSLIDPDLKERIWSFLEEQNVQKASHASLIHQLTSDKNTALQEISLLTAELQAVTSKNTSETATGKQSRISELEKKLQEFSMSINEKDERISHLLKIIAKLEDEIRVEKENEDLQSRLVASERTNAEQAKHIEELSRKIASMKQADAFQPERVWLSDLSSTHGLNSSQSERSIESLNGECLPLVMESLRLGEKNEYKLAKLSSEEVESNFVQKITILEESLNITNSNLSRTQAQLHAATSEKDSLIVKIIELTNELSTFKEQSREREKTATSEVTLLHQQLLDLQTSISEKDKLIETRDQEMLRLAGNSERLSMEVGNLKQDLFKVQKEKKHLEAQNKTLQSDIEALNTTLAEHISSETTLKQSLANVSAQLTDLQAQELEHSTSMSSLQSKLSAALRERTTQVDEYIRVQEKNNQLESALETCHHELENLQRIVLDLGRQNQTLQIAQERLNNRQWVDDDSAAACTSCSRGFSISLRKHHCRRCGNLFCQSCSMKRAPTPASKAPLRVCDTCFNELTGSL